MNLIKHQNFIKELADSSEKIIKKYFNKDNFEIDLKNDASPVTIADKESEKVMREMIMRKFPTHGIIGEEFPDLNPNADFVWVLDPIDGTYSFVNGSPLFGTLISFLQEGKPIVGAINIPMLEQLYIGDNEKCYLNNNQIKMKNNNLDEALLLITDLIHINKYKNRNNFDELLKKVSMFRMWGDCFGYTLLAQGKADIMIDAVMKKWDIMALIPIIRGAGGVISTYEGDEPENGDSIIATNKLIHSQVIDILNK